MFEMKNIIIKNKKGVTLMEIMLALIILALTFIPLIATIGGSVKDTDVINSYIFAQTTARNILDALLDDVPFNSIKTSSDDIAELVNYKSYDISIFKEMMGVTSSNKAQGTIIDERGISYKITIYAFPIEASNNKNHSSEELLFTYLPRPLYENASSTVDDIITNSWYTYTSEAKSAYIQKDVKNPYTYEVSEEVKNAFELGAINNYDSYCIMKKILLRIEWVGRDKNQRCIELYTLKANLDSEK